MCYREGHAGAIASYSHMDNVLDFLVSQKIRPVISLDNKPRYVMKGINTFVYEKKSEMIFKDTAECVGVLGDFLTHIISRYGIGEVQTWIFDCWWDEFYENTMGSRETSRMYLTLSAKRSGGIFPAPGPAAAA